MTDKRCGTCGRGYENGRGAIECGAAVDDAALHDGVIGSNPVWAWRKYSPVAIMAQLGGLKVKNGDCANMDPNDGDRCVVWEPKP